MFWLSEQTRVFLRTGVTDGRLGTDALRGLVGKAMRLHPIESPSGAPERP